MYIDDNPWQVVMSIKVILLILVLALTLSEILMFDIFTLKTVQGHRVQHSLVITKHYSSHYYASSYRFRYIKI